jgi:molybdopterin molybdotransferase
MAASVGLRSVQVARRPRVALFSTGDELVMPGTWLPGDMRPGAIYNSNRFFLRAMLLRLGCTVSDLRHRARPARCNRSRRCARRHSSTT